MVEHWPLVGWLTGGVMAATLYFGSMVLPYTVAVLLAIAARLLLTGALHEDGLADSSTDSEEGVMTVSASSTS